MIDREKVIEALEACVLKDPDDSRDCRHCPRCNYGAFITNSCINGVMADCLSLLKEQEPRVMTLEEVKAFDWDYCFLEEVRLPGKEYRAVCGDYALTCITWPCVASMRIQHGDEKYGKKWRCWTARPTDEQREAVKWDE